jgi:hypothetical protein
MFILTTISGAIGIRAYTETDACASNDLSEKQAVISNRVTKNGKNLVFITVIF